MLIFNITFFKLFQALASASILFPVILGIVEYRKMNGVLSLLLIFLIISLLTEITAYSMALNGIANLPILHLFSIIQVVFISFIYYKSFPGKRVKKGIIFTSIALLIFLIVNSFYIQGFNKFDSNGKGLAGLYFIVLSLMYFHEIFNKEILIKLEEQPMFWINTGILTYFSGNMFLFTFFNEKFFAIESYYFSLYLIHAVFYLFYIFFVSRGLWCLRKI